jgi:hypothetical protein
VKSEEHDDESQPSKTFKLMSSFPFFFGGAFLPPSFFGGILAEPGEAQRCPPLLNYIIDKHGRY